MWIYSQSTGALRFAPSPLDPASTPEIRAVGYSGTGIGRNNPKLQTVSCIGPIPRGTYIIGDPYNTETHGPHVLALTPDPGNEMHGRAGFLIHGDNRAGDASRGCIILDRTTRGLIAKSSDRVLHVVE